MHTEEFYERFWQAMRERFGQRWTDTYGERPNRTWKYLLRHYTPREVRHALDAMSTKGWAHPPTLPQFEPLLVAAQSAVAKDNTDYGRGYWRTAVTKLVSDELRRRGLIDTPERFEQFLLAHASTLGASMRAVLDEACRLEAVTGQRTYGIEAYVMNACRELGTGWSMPPSRSSP